jgi:hypothetical protein
MNHQEQQILGALPSRVSKAVAYYWRTRALQSRKQEQSGKADSGLRSAVTGGAQMDGFTALFMELVQACGIARDCIFTKTNVELPGFFRPTKEWDLLVVHKSRLLAALEAKSQVGPSFGNNFNNRTEEAMGSALDLWTAYREGALSGGVQPFLGYFFMLEDCAASDRAVRVREPHFKVFPEFVDASYKRRYELFCRKLVLERHYTAAAFITSTSEGGTCGVYKEPASDLGVGVFARALVAHVSAFV